MFVLGNLLEGVGSLLILVLNLYMLAIFIYAVMSWVSPNPYNPFVRFVTNVSEPVLGVIRGFLPRGLGVDLSPLIAIGIIYLTRKVVAESLLQMGRQLQ
jgi:YggT family protein